MQLASQLQAASVSELASPDSCGEAKVRIESKIRRCKRDSERNRGRFDLRDE